MAWLLADYESIGCYYTTHVDIVTDYHYLLDGYIPNGRHEAIKKCALVAYNVEAKVFGIVEEGHCVIGE